MFNWVLLVRTWKFMRFFLLPKILSIAIVLTGDIKRFLLLLLFFFFGVWLGWHFYSQIFVLFYMFFPSVGGFKALTPYLIELLRPVTKKDFLVFTRQIYKIFDQLIELIIRLTDWQCCLFEVLQTLFHILNIIIW